MSNAAQKKSKPDWNHTEIESYHRLHKMHYDLYINGNGIAILN